ncbi:oxygen-independent coproporphyrinogen III oxidase [Pseudophaeobacter sp.]|uniref:oxygen-independent coproporphyrinogen III oxidase n=1 Tax=Pseudophaeobacter sp. TaxID=1971739 RepID=UPI0032999050
MCQKSQLAKLGLFDAKVPRYTSYPTVPHFQADVGAADYAAWIQAIPAGSRISLYLHIPFCHSLCWFCMCRTQGTRSNTPIAGYLAAIKQEIALLKAQLPAGISLSRLHWDGGTPTILSPEMIKDVTAALSDLAPLAPDGEFSVEIDPNEFDQPRCDALLAAGLTRASIGIQGFDEITQQAIGRKLEFETVQNVVAMLRQGGVEDFSADLLFGLPYQTPERIAQSTRQLLSLAPDRLALYGYKHLPAMIRRQTMIPSESLPTPEDRLGLFETARDLCRKSGYKDIGIDNFAKPQDGLCQAREARTLRRGFQGYNDDPAPVLIGLGASAISRFPQGYVQNAPSTARYMSAVENGRFAAARSHIFADDDRLRGYMIESLLCTFDISRHEIRERFGDQEGQFDTLVAKASQAFPDMLVETEDSVSLRQSARPLARVIARHFDAYEGS